MLLKNRPAVLFLQDKIFCRYPIGVIISQPLRKGLNRIAAALENHNFRIVFFGDHRKTIHFIFPECFFGSCGDDQDQHEYSGLFHLVFLLAFLVFFNINSFAACAENSCNLYNDDEYADCASSTTGWPQYQCGGGSGSCSDVCGGCGWRPHLAGILRNNRDQLDQQCKEEMGCSDARCSGIKTINQLAIGRCGVGFNTATGYAPICVGCMSSSEPSSSSSSSSSSSLSSSSNPKPCLTASQALSVLQCELTPWSDNCWSLSNWCSSHGYCGGSWEYPQGGGDGTCFIGYRYNYNSSGPRPSTLGGCMAECQSSSLSSSVSSSSSEDISSDDGGDSQGGDGSSSTEGSSGSGDGGGGDGIPCGWGSYPPCETYQVNNPPGLCAAYPDVCYTILSLDDSLGGLHRAMQDVAGGVGAVRDTLAGFHSDVNDSLHRLMELMSGQDTTAAGGFDSIPYVSGDGPDTTGSGGVPGGSWVRSVIDGISIPTAARSCPSVPKVTIQLLGRPFDVDYDICSEAYYVANTHPLQLVGLFFRAIAGIVAVFIVIGSISSLNGGLHRMKILGRG